MASTLRKVLAVSNEFVAESSSALMAVVYRDVEWNEYRVKYTRAGVYQKRADSHHDDKQDAIDSANHFVKVTA